MTTERDAALNDLLLEMTPEVLRGLDPAKIIWTLSDQAIRRIFEACDALWLHNGDPSAPHAELTSGLCSNGFVNVMKVLHRTNLCRIMARQLVRQLQASKVGWITERVIGSDDAGATIQVGWRPEWVVGSDHAGATLSFAVAEELMARHDFTVKMPDKSQAWQRFVIEPGEQVLQVEELITTTKTLQAVRDGIVSGNPQEVTFAPVVLVLVNRSSISEFHGAEIIHVAHYDIKTWRPDECLLCRDGSERLRPKTNWAKLTG